MISKLLPLIQEKKLFLQNKSPFVVKVKNQKEGFSLIKSLLENLLDKKSVLFLSGGRTPRELYANLAAEKSLQTGAVGLIDERYGPPALAYGKSHWRAGERFHDNSNEKMFRDSGLLAYLDKQSIPFYPILENKDIQETARDYDETLRFLQNGFQKSVGILGIGLDGHTAGIPVGSAKLAGLHKFVEWFDDFPGPQKERITMTFHGLSMLDYLFVLVFGKEKKKALEQMFASGPPAGGEEVPSRFFKRPDIAKKTLLITDQKV